MSTSDLFKGIIKVINAFDLKNQANRLFTFTLEKLEILMSTNEDPCRKVARYV